MAECVNRRITQRGKFVCTAMKMDCPGDCRFAKTPEEAKADREKSLARLKNLEYSQRVHIAEKYGIEGIV